MKNLHPLSRQILTALSFAIILITGVLEFYYPLEVFIWFGYLIGLTLTVVSNSKRYALWAASLAVLLIVTISIYHQDHEAIEALLLSRAYMGIGLSITVFLVLLAIQRKSKADDYRTQMAGIFAHGTQGIILANHVGDIVLVNPFTEKLFGYTSSELIGSKINRLLPGVGNDEITANNSGYGLRKDLLAYRKDKSDFPVEVSSNHYESAKKTYIVTFVTDISIRKHNEEILKAKTKELEVVNQQLEAFSYSVSHDLRSPLRAIAGYAQMLHEDYSDLLDVEGKRFLINIQNSAQRMGVLIDDLLAFSRLGRKEILKTKVDMTQLVHLALDEINQSVTHHAEVNISLLHPVLADSSLMTRVMINLLSNAIKYSSKTLAPCIQVSSTIENDKVIFCVRDNGAGFDMQYVHKLFGVFQRLHSDNEFQGTGVGLAIVQRIIHRHGGEIWAEGKEGVGASFYFTLPAADEGHQINAFKNETSINNTLALVEIDTKQEGKWKMH